MKAFILFSFLVITPLAFGQAFQDLATNEDGSLLYFASTVRQKGTTDPFYSKIFLWDASQGVRAFAQVNEPGPSDGCSTANYYQLKGPQVTADMRVFAYTATRPGQFRQVFCPATETAQAVIGTLGSVQRLAGTVAISRNGRYAITTPGLAIENGFHVVTDLTTGVSTPVPGAFNGWQSRVTDDGATLSTGPSAVFLTDRAGRQRVYTTTRTVQDAIVDRAGTKILYRTPLSPGRGGTGASPAVLTSIDVASGVETAIVANGQLAGFPQLSSDGQTVFFIDAADGTSQLLAVNADGTNRRQVTHEPAGVSFNCYVVSGDGRVVFYQPNASAQIKRLDIPSGKVTELMAPTPFINSIYRRLAFATDVAPVGSMLDVFATPSAVNRISLCGQTVPTTAGANYLEFQVPWDQREGDCQVVASGAAELEHGVTLTVQKFAPWMSYVYHDGFRSMVGLENPAQGRRATGVLHERSRPGERGRPTRGAGLQLRVRFPPGECRVRGPRTGRARLLPDQPDRPRRNAPRSPAVLRLGRPASRVATALGALRRHLVGPLAPSRGGPATPHTAPGRHRAP